MSWGDAMGKANQEIIGSYLHYNIFDQPDENLFNGYKLRDDANIKSEIAGDLDWFKAAIRSGFRQEYNISGDGGSKSSNYYLGVGYTKEDGYTNFILAQKNGNVGFYLVKNGSTLGANKAYLPLPTASLNFGAGARLSMVFDDMEDGEPTVIPDVSNHTKEIQTGIFNLNGQRLESLQRGINIVGGKKVFIK